MKKKNKHLSFTKFLFILAFSLRLFFCILNVYNIPFPNSKSNDAKNYSTYGLEALEGDNEKAFVFNISSSFFICIFIGIIQKITGSKVFLPLIVMAVFGSYAVVFFYKAASLCLTSKSSKVVSLILAITPTYIFLSRVLLREAPIHFCFSLHLYYLLLWFKDNKTSTYIKALISIFFACILHFGLICFLIGLIILASLKLLLNKKHFIRNSILTLIFIISFFSIVITLKIGASKMPWLYQDNTSIGLIFNTIFQKQINVLNMPKSIYSGIEIPSNLFEFLVFTFPRMVVRFLLNSLYHKDLLIAKSAIIVSSPETLFYAILVICSIFSIKKDKQSIYLTIISWLTIFIFTLGVFEEGQAKRHLFKFVSVFLLISYPFLKILLLRFFPTKK